MFPYNNLQDSSLKDKVIVLIDKLSCYGCNNDGTSGNGGTTIDAGMKELLIKAIQAISCGNCGGE